MCERQDAAKFPSRRKIRLPRAMYRQGNACLITIGTGDRHPWFRIHPAVSKAFGEIIAETAAQRDAQVLAWCAMPDHVHLLAQDVDVIDFVRLIKGRLTPTARRYERSRRMWQRGFHDHVLRREESLERVSLYILENPVRSGLVNVATDYPWSGSNVWPEWRASYDAAGGRR